MSQFLKEINSQRTIWFVSYTGVAAIRSMSTGQHVQQNYSMPFCCKGAHRIIHWELRPKNRKSRPKVEGGVGFMGSKPLPTSYGSDRCELPSEVRAEPRPHKGFSQTLTLRMASRMVLLIVDCHAAVGGGEDPRAPLAYVPVQLHTVFIYRNSI